MQWLCLGCTNDAEHSLTRRSSRSSRSRRADATVYSSTIVSRFVSEPGAPRLSRMVTVIVLVPRTLSPRYVCPTENEPAVVLVPVDVEPSPQLIVYVHGPLSGSLNDTFCVYSAPSSTVWSGPAFTTGAVFGGVTVVDFDAVPLCAP